MYKAKNMNIIILHFKDTVSFQVLFFEIKDKNLVINKFFMESKNHFLFSGYKPLCVFKHKLLTPLHYTICYYHIWKMLKCEQLMK